MEQIKIGTQLNHPVHGPLTVTHIDPKVLEEHIEGEWRTGYTVHAEFAKFIPGVHWRTGSGKNTRSKLVFHSFYLTRLGAHHGN